MNTALDPPAGGPIGRDVQQPAGDQDPAEEIIGVTHALRKGEQPAEEPTAGEGEQPAEEPAGEAETQGEGTATETTGAE